MNHRRIAMLIVFAGLLGGCRTSPLFERDDDLGRHAPVDRLRRVDGLELDKLKADVEGKPAPAAVPDTVTSEAATNALNAIRQRYKAQKQVDLTLTQARAEVLKNNLDLKAAVLEPGIAREAFNAERAKFDVVFTPFVNFSSVDQPTLPGPTGTIDNRFRRTQVGAGVSIPLRTGGRASIDFTENITDSNNPFDSGGVTHTPALTFSIVQPLLRGAGREVNTASIVIAGYAQQAAEARTKLAVISQLALTERAYWTVFAAAKELEVRQQQYELATELLARAERRMKVGEMKQVEIVRAQSGVASRLEAIINAETSLLISQREFKRLINMPGVDLGDGVTVKPATVPDVFELNLDGRAAELVTLAQNGRMELLENELELLADGLNIDVARNATLPGLDLSASFSTQGGNRSIGQGFGDLLTGRFTGTTLGVQADVPLSNEGALSRHRRAVLTRVQRLATRDSRLQTIQQDVLDAVDRVRSGWQRIMAAKQSSVLAGRTLQAEQRLFDQGLRTATDVLDAAASLADAQSAEIRALADYQIALVDLATATGTTLGAAGVRWEEPGAGK